MTSLLLFAAACLAIVLVGWTVSRITGARAHLLEDWAFEEGEAITWRDDAADLSLLPLVGPPRRVMRLGRWAVVATDRRIIAANRTLTGRKMVMYVLHPGPAPDAESRRAGGGLLTRGYATLAIRPGVMEARLTGEPDTHHVALKPIVTAGSSFNILEIRIYTTLAESFRPP